MADNSWKSNPNLKNIDPAKLDILLKLAEESKSKSSSEIIPFFIAATTSANQRGINFTDAETDLILSILKERMSKEDIGKIDQIRQMAKMFSK